MLETFKTVIVSQFEAALSMLKACVDKCAETAWNAPVVSHRFSQVVLHTLFWADFYLGPDKASFRRQPFHLRHEELFNGYEEFEDRPGQADPFELAQPRLYDKASVLAYLEFCGQKVAAVVAAETTETVSAPSGFRSPDLSRAEMYLYNLRHIEHHAAVLSLRLRLDANEEILWVGSGRQSAITG